MAFSIRSAEADDWQAVKELLQEENLPVADLEVQRMPDFLIAESASGDVIGSVGLEQFADCALLRSLVIAKDNRHAGLGRALVERLEALAQRCGAAQMWLLTIDAEDFFRRLGYTRRERSDAPEAIRGTDEFSTLCPGDACLMSRDLDLPEPG